MNVEIGTEATQFPEEEYIYAISLQCGSVGSSLNCDSSPLDSNPDNDQKSTAILSKPLQNTDAHTLLWKHFGIHRSWGPKFLVPEWGIYSRLRPRVAELARQPI